MAKDKDKAVEAPAVTVNAPNIIWRGEGEPPSAIHGLTVNGQAVTVEVPPTARDGFYSPHAGVLAEGVEGFKRFVAGVGPTEG